jgi:Zn-dependent protease
MRRDREFEALIASALKRRGQPAPFSIDVADRVMARVADLGAPRRSELSLRQFGRWALAASIVGAALTGAAFWQGPSLATAGAEALHLMADATGAALKLAPPAHALAGTLGRVALALVSSIKTLVQPLEPLQPLANAMLAALAVVMLSITSFIVGRDVSGRVADKERA